MRDRLAFVMNAIQNADVSNVIYDDNSRKQMDSQQQIIVKIRMRTSGSVDITTRLF